MMTQKKECKCLYKSKLNNHVQTSVVFTYSINNFTCWNVLHVKWVTLAVYFLSDWVIKPWVQQAFRANFVQLLHIYLPTYLPTYYLPTYMPLYFPILTWEWRLVFKSIPRKSLLENIQKLKYASTISFSLFLQ